MSKVPNIYPYENEDGETRYAVCHWVQSAGQYQVPLDAEARRLTGCHTEFASSPAALNGLESLSKARRHAKALYGYSKVKR